MDMPRTQTSPLAAGFASPVLGSQACFRALLKAMSFPGRIVEIPTMPGPPPGWPPGLAAAALTLFDADTPVWLDASARSAEAEAYVRFHAGAPLADAPAGARFAVVLAPEYVPYDAFAIGTDQYPDRSATVLIGVKALLGGQAIRLRGPGVLTHADVAPAGALEAFWLAWFRNNKLYPLGFDAFFFDKNRVIGLPRSAQASLIEG